MRISKIRNSFTFKAISLTMVIILLGEIFAPQKVFALTGGPSQPEVQSFEPIGTTDMVDAFSGDFTYNIPLMDVDGYPINLSYHSGIGMDQEASWCGLGWNINPGVINRNIRGIPDDFSGDDKVTKESNIKANQTFRVDLGTSLELIGLDANGSGGGSYTGGATASNGLGLNVSFGLGIYYNNYRGMGYSLTAGASMSIGPLGLGAQMGFDNQSGIDFSPNVSLTARLGKDNSGASNDIRGGISMGYNSRGGLRQLTFSASYERGYQISNNKNKEPKVGVSGGLGANGSASVDFASPTYIPNVTPGMYSFAFTLTGKFGVAAWALDPTFSGSVNYSENGVSTKQRDYDAYGYLYAENGVNNDYAMQDLTREKEGGFSKYRKFLPLSTHSYDVYSVSGQGTGGVFVPHRGNIGTINDARAENINWPSVNITIEAGVGPPPSGKVGGNIKVAWSDAHSGIWRDGNNSLANLTFLGETANQTFEPVYFKNAGEKSVNDVTHYGKYGNTKAVRVDLSDNVDDAIANSVFVDDNGGSYPINSSIKRSNREKRNQVITYLTGDMASVYGLESKIKNYKRGSGGGPSYLGGNLEIQSYIDRVSDDRKKHHISEVTSINPDGTRYVYGIPAYNFVHVEKTFNVYDAIPCSTYTGIIEYDPGDNTINNDHGIDHYYSATKMPPYAHSYLLTSVLSPDYIDVTGDGPTTDDYGKYTKLNYSQANSKSDPYKWRTPFYDANHNEGLKSDNSQFEKNNDRRDDKGSYIYGEKEVWYLNSIETKNYIAEFYVSPRNDGKGVSSEDQENPQTSLGASSMKLDSIKLYSRFDRTSNPSTAVPIKVVHFEYDYSLCVNIHNATAGTGKLTLKRVWFTYGKNSRGSLNDYEFTYSSTNPNYNIKAYDRWGNYKPNDPDCSNLQNGDFPYVDQSNWAQSDTYASAWHLASIKLPSGGKITINYESDDYAYVQNKPAMQMLKIKGFGDTSAYLGANDKLFGFNGLDINPYDYIYFQMDSNYTTDAAVKEAYFKNMNIMYYNFLTNLTDNINPNERSEYVAGYMEILDAGKSPTGTKVGWVKIKPVPIGDREGTGYTHPVTKAALQYLRVNCTELAYPPENPSLYPGLFDIIGVIFQFLQEIKTMILGFNYDRMSQNYCKQVTLSKSWIRVVEDSGFKKGGGSRVGSINFSDEWSTMTSSNESTFTYGQNYDYSMTDPQTGKTISSGVASYEPTIGGDENPWRMPVKYTEEIAGAPNNDYYVETPLGESYFPSPSVGYRRVEVSNIKPAGVNKRRGTGKTVYEFYTSAEFPTITDQTGLDPEVHKPFSLFSFFGLEQEEFATASQGFSIELNDMHGKPKAQWQYSENDAVTPLSGVEYFYKLNNDDNLSDLNYPGSKLNNTVTVLQTNGTYADKIIGLEVDMVVDANESEEHNYVVGAQVNVDGFLAAIVPIVIPMILPEFSSTHNRIKTITATKVVNRYGILTKTIAHDNGATLKTENLAWDAETGEVLLTKTQNEYREDIYNLTYPSHWAYDGMGQAYKNAGLKVNFTMVNGMYTGSLGGIAGLLVPGDELGIVNPSVPDNGESKLWVLDVNRNGTDTVTFVYRDGTSPSGTQNVTCRVLRSGRRNMQTIPIMSVSTKSNVLGSGSSFTNAFSNVISSSGVEYSEDWHMFKPATCSSLGCSTNQVRNLNPAYVPFYVDMLNELIKQERLNTSGISTQFWNTYGWSPSFLTATNVSTGLLGSWPSICNSTYSGDDIFGTISGTTYYGLEINVNDSGSCTLPAGWCSQFKIYSTEGSALVPDLINEVAYFLPGASNCKGSVPNMSTLNYLTGTNTNFYVTAVLKSGRKVVCSVDAHCSVSSPETLTELSGLQCCRTDSILNPYIWNLKGNWRPLRNFVYYDKVDSTFERKQSETVANNYNSTFTKLDGTIRNYKPIWKYSGSKWVLETYNNPTSPWTWQSLISAYSPFQENENKDALNVYSSAIYGYNQTLPIAVAQNAMLRQIAYEGFEDHYLSVSGACTFTPHFSFKGAGGTWSISRTNVHSGNYSLKLNNGDTTSVNRTIRNYNYTSVSNNPTPIVKNFKYKPQHLIEAFSPLGTNTGSGYSYGNVVNKTCSGKYVLSYWIKTDNPYSTPTDPILIYIDNVSTPLTSTGNDQVVEGWKRIERTFSISSGTPANIRVKLTNSTSPSSIMYYDDIRIQPFNSSMKTFAYDYISQRLMAQMDENNYATFYEYDEQGNLIRIKKETERGIMTIQESRQKMNDH